MGVDISGGTSSKRHLLNSVDYTLNEFLDILFCYKSEFIKKYIIYESQKKSSNYILSSSIDLTRYKEGLDYFSKGSKNKKLEDMTYDDVEKINNHFKKEEEYIKHNNDDVPIAYRM